MKVSLFQGVLLGVFGVAALIGLFVFATYTNKGSGGAAAVGNVTIWGTLPAADMNAALAGAVQADTTQSLKNVSYVEKPANTFSQEITAAIATGNAPDLVLISQEQLLSLASVIQPVPASSVSASAFQNAFADGGAIFQAPNNAGSYGLPYLIDPLVMFDNKTILSSDSIPRPPTNWEALTGLVPHVASVNGHSITRSLIALGTYANVRNARGILSALFLQTGVPVTTRSANGIMSANLSGEVGAGGVQAGQAVLRFYTQFADPTKVSYTWNASLPDSQTAFLNGDLALYLGYASEARYFASANPNLDFDITALPQPGNATVRSTYGLIYALAIPRGAPNASGALQAATLLTQSGEQQAAASATGLAPASRTALSNPPADANLARAYASAVYAKGWLSPAPSDTDGVFSGMITAVGSGRLSLDMAIAAAQSSLNAILQ